jgi:hypothetical protein
MVSQQVCCDPFNPTCHHSSIPSRHCLFQTTVTSAPVTRTGSLPLTMRRSRSFWCSELPNLPKSAEILTPPPLAYKYLRPVSKKITKSPFCLFLLIYAGHDRTSREFFFTSPLRRLFTVSTKCRPWGNFEIRARTGYVVSKAVCLFALLFAKKGIE